ncbi:uncharacterized protein LOC114713729 [Neltuma alba]|uniref:uncharacterized protein LOC114713729 n=1 Tax=Neltuma alba TaxID=207710 RepID=UPI0010A4EEAC|nr:uncharacterized protein LOC114713729 [Prosopis alba]
MSDSTEGWGEGWEDDEGDEWSQLLSALHEHTTQLSELGVLMGQYVTPFLCKQPCRTSEQTGYLWVQELLDGHEGRSKEMFRMETETFHRLCSKLVEHGLQNTKYIGVHESVAMFLNIIAHGQCNRMIQERFQHSGETVSRHFHRVLAACLNLSRENIRPTDPTFSYCHPKIANDPRYFPFFRDAIGAIDGTHIRCKVSQARQDKYINRKGFPSQNVMAVCDWNMCFTFVLAGWEGSAHDARVFHSAISTPSLNFPHPPEGKYYLVDASYPSQVGYLGPYRRERYHLPDFNRHPRFTNQNEAFNYYHSSLRSTIERTFGVWKNRFAILSNMPRFKFQTQVGIVCATMAVHNFIRQNSPTGDRFIEAEHGSVIDEENNHASGEASSSSLTSAAQMNRVCDSIRDQIVQSLLSN